MELLKDLNIVEILKLGAIGLGFLLAFMSYQLIRKEQEKDKPNDSFLSTAKVFMFFSLAMMVLGIIAEFVRTKSSLNIQLGNREVSINELSYTPASALSTSDYFINSELGFAFKKPGTNWSAIKSEKGINGLLNIMQVKSDLVTQKTLEAGFDESPLGNMLKAMDLYYFENTQSKTTISASDSSGNDLIDEIIEKQLKILPDSTDSLRSIRTNYLNELRRELIGFDSFVSKEAFLLSIYPKDSLPNYLHGLKLPGFYTAYTMAMGVNIDKLVANEKQILCGSELTLKNMKIRNSVTVFQNKKWLMFSESDKYFYVIEISYSPQLSSSVDLWDELQNTMNSFTILLDK